MRYSKGINFFSYELFQFYVSCSKEFHLIIGTFFFIIFEFSDYDFIKAVSPEHVVFSTGFDNQWHFPREEVVARYLNNKVKVWITHAHGAIIFELYPSQPLEVQAWRSAKSHFWLEY